MHLAAVEHGLGNFGKFVGELRQLGFWRFVYHALTLLLKVHLDKLKHSLRLSHNPLKQIPSLAYL